MSFVDEEEEMHWISVMKTMKSYHQLIKKDIDRRQKHLNLVPQSVVDRLPSSVFDKLSRIDDGASKNQIFFDDVVRFEKSIHYGSLDDKIFEEKYRNVSIMYNNQHRNQAILHSLFREWSIDGAVERSQSFQPLIDELKNRIPVNENNAYNHKVLVPGSGLGRLPLEIASLGYKCQGNEFSVYMAMPSNYILNGISEAMCYDIYPWLDKVSNVVHAYDIVESIKIPDISAGEFLAKGVYASAYERRKNLEDTQNEQEITMNTPHNPEDYEYINDKSTKRSRYEIDHYPIFSMCLGDFESLYHTEEHHNSWDAIVTCFFIDTAPVVMTYLDTIYHILKPGGYWMNLGPLLYHWVNDVDCNGDERFSRSIELSWEELRHVILSFGFIIVQEQWQECTYTLNSKFMMKNIYRAIFFTVQKPLEKENSK